MENYVSINSDRLWARLNEVGILEVIPEVESVVLLGNPLIRKP